MERSDHPVVIALDPRSHDLAPAALGLALARLSGARIVLAAAFMAERNFDREYPAYSERARLDVEQALRHVAALLACVPGKPVAAATAAESAGRSTAATLEALAVRLEASMLVAGTSPRAFSARRLPPSFTDQLLSRLPCPVAVAPPGFSFRNLGDSCVRVGVAFDETPQSRVAVNVANELAARGNGVVRVLAVIEPVQQLAVGAVVGPGLAEAERARAMTAERALRRGLAGVPANLSAGGELLLGNPFDALAAASLELDLLVVGARPRRAAIEVLGGNAAHALVRQAECPVLVVPCDGQHAVP
jgi:nucleotide-binding universal stress UspA family protein